jgi:hypothetical protein
MHSLVVRRGEMGLGAEVVLLGVELVVVLDDEYGEND